MEFRVEFRKAGRRRQGEMPNHGVAPGMRVRAAAFHAGAMAGGQRGRLIAEEKLGIARSPDGPMPALEGERAADPGLAFPARRAERPGCRIVDPAAAIAHERPLRGVGGNSPSGVTRLGRGIAGHPG